MNENEVFITVADGQRAYIANPAEAVFSVANVAAQLSKKCRWNGATTVFYSVAQHCVYVAERVSVGNKGVALMHDAAEIGIGDWPSPIKRMPSFRKAYRFFESGMTNAIATRYSFPPQLPDEVAEADARALLTEARDIMPAGTLETIQDVFPGLEPYPEEIRDAWQPHFAETKFMKMAVAWGVG